MIRVGNNGSASVFQEIAPGVFVPTAQQPPIDERAERLRATRELTNRVIDGFDAIESAFLGARQSVRQQLRHAKREADQHNETLREVKRCLRRRMK